MNLTLTGRIFKIYVFIKIDINNMILKIWLMIFCVFSFFFNIICIDINGFDIFVFVFKCDVLL